LTPKDGGWTVEIGFLATDLERMFQETMNERANVDLSRPGVLEDEIGKFVARRVAMHDAGGRTCGGQGRDGGRRPEDPGQRAHRAEFQLLRRLHHIRRDETPGRARPARQAVVTLTGVKNAGQTMLNGASKPLDLTKPLETTWQLMQKFGLAGIEHILTGYDHICF